MRCSHLLAVAGSILAAAAAVAGREAGADGDAAGPAGTIGFTASQMGVPLAGSFGRFAADIDLDPEHPEAGSVKVGVEVGSVRSGAADADALLVGPDFLDAAAFPGASFEVHEFRRTGAGQYLATGTFTLKGRSRVLPVAFTASGGAQGPWFDGSFTISRLEFHVGQGQWADTSTLDDAVPVQFHLRGRRPQRPVS
jgi:polyisoprenoid-binding protein YceI